LIQRLLVIGDIVSHVHLYLFKSFLNLENGHVGSCCILELVIFKLLKLRFLNF